MKRTILLFFALCSALRLEAQPLTLDEAIELALRQNPAAKAAAWRVHAADEERRAAFGLYLPAIGVVGNYTYLDRSIEIGLNYLKKPLQGLLPTELPTAIGSLIEPLFQADWGLKLQDRSFGFAGAHVTLPIWMGGKIRSANRAARLRLDRMESQQRQALDALRTEVIERYFGLVLAIEVEQLRKQAVATMQQHLRDAVLLEENGMIAHADRLYIEVQVAEAIRHREQAALEVATLQSALQRTLSTDTLRLPVTPIFLLDTLAPRACFQQAAQACNPQLQEAKEQQQLAEEGVNLAQAARMPEVVAMGGGMVHRYRVSGLVPRWAVGIGVSIPLFNGLNRTHQYRAARATAAQVAALVEEAHEQLNLGVEERYNALLDARNRVRSLEESIRFAEEYRRIKRIAFREGGGTATELMDAELNLAAIHTERLEAAYAFDRGLAQLLQLAGWSDHFTTYQQRSDARAISYQERGEKYE